MKTTRTQSLLAAALNSYRSPLARLALVGPLACAVVSPPALADEGGVSVWLPGQFGSLAAVPGEPGWSLPMVYYHASASASGGRTLQSVAGFQAAWTPAPI